MSKKLSVSKNSSRSLGGAKKAEDESPVKKLRQLTGGLTPAETAELDRLLRQSKGRIDLARFLLPQQLSLVLDPRRFRTACTTRRAGKSVGIAMALLDVCQRKPGSVGLYITSTRVNAKRIIWGILKQAVTQIGIAASPNESDLSLSFSNGSRIYLLGANNRASIEDARGLPVALCVIDEAQCVPEYVKNLVDEVIAPALIDHQGSLILTGTPGPVPAGYYYDCCHSEGWSHHAWTLAENHFLLDKAGKSAEEIVQEEIQRRGVQPDDPVILREWRGQWVLDINSLVFKFGVHNLEPVIPTLNHYVLGVDLGWDDADALCVLGWGKQDQNVHLVSEDVTPKQTITELGEKLLRTCEIYNPHRVVIDAGGLGKKIIEELKARFPGLPLEAADKNRKNEHIELLNDALKGGRFRCLPATRFQHDCSKVEWDRSDPQKLEISNKYHSDICDAVLYAYRCCRGYAVHPQEPVDPQQALRDAQIRHSVRSRSPWQDVQELQFADDQFPM